MRDVLNLPTEEWTAGAPAHRADGAPGRGPGSEFEAVGSRRAGTASREVCRVTQAIAYALGQSECSDSSSDVERESEPPKPAAAVAHLRMAGHRPKAAAAGKSGGQGANAAFFSTSERRQFPRRDSGCTVKMHVLGENETQGDERHTDWLLRSSPVGAELLDISMSGLALEVTEPVPENARLLLRLENRQFDRRLDTIAVVLRCEIEPDGSRRIVCRFERKLSFEQVHDFGRHLFRSAIV